MGYTVTKPPEISAFCLPWHLTNSPAFNALLVEPLSKWANIRLVGWDEATQADLLASAPADSPLIFCQVLPPKAILEQPNSKIVWIPMWDHARYLSDQNWAALPKTLRIVAFSNVVTEKSQAAKLPTLRLQYFKNPVDFPVAQWNQGRVLFYWNRVGLYRHDFLKAFCRALNIDTLLLRDTLDVRIPTQGRLNLPTKLGQTEVRQLHNVNTYSSYISALSPANIYLAPRLYEGVGMTFIEALAKGCAVFSYNAPTANEYIQHGKSGYFLNNVPIHWSIRRAMFGLRRRLVPFGIKKTDFEDFLADCQKWSEFSTLDLQKMGENARADQFIGYERWQHQIDEYARFVLDW
jgi:glycosyltransferase involved in cell wall biosynthesis